MPMIKLHRHTAYIFFGIWQLCKLLENDRWLYPLKGLVTDNNPSLACGPWPPRGPDRSPPLRYAVCFPADRSFQLWGLSKPTPIRLISRTRAPARGKQWALSRRQPLLTATCDSQSLYITKHSSALPSLRPCVLGGRFVWAFPRFLQRGTNVANKLYLRVSCSWSMEVFETVGVVGILVSVQK